MKSSLDSSILSLCCSLISLKITNETAVVTRNAFIMEMMKMLGVVSFLMTCQISNQYVLSFSHKQTSTDVMLIIINRGRDLGGETDRPVLSSFKL